MLVDQRPPTVARRLLRLKLRRARRELGKTQQDVAVALDWSASKILRIEAGASTVSVSDLLALLTQYPNLGDEQVELVALAKESKSPPVVSNYADVLTPQFSMWLDHEAYATRIRQFEPILVPGMLQTLRYASAAVRGLLDPEADDRDPDRIVAARRDRIAVLLGPRGPIMEFILDEAVVRRAVGAEPGHAGYVDMAEQLRYLQQHNTRGRAQLGEAIEPSLNPNISIQIVPLVRGIYRCMRGPFEIIEFQSEEDQYMMYCESPDDDVVIRESGEEISGNLIEKNGRMFDELKAELPDPASTNQFLSELLGEMPELAAA